MSGLFIGISVDPARAVECLESAKQLWAAHKYLKWFTPESLHCTLAYVQPLDQHPDTLAKTKRIMIETMKQIGASAYIFNSYVDQFEWFGAGEILALTRPEHKPGTQRLTRLSERLVHDLRQRHLDVFQSQPFRAHVSLGKREVEPVRADSAIYLVPPSQPLRLELSAWQLKLFQPVGNHQYVVLHTTPLMRSHH